MLYFAALMVAALYFVTYLGPPLWARATTEETLREWAKGRGLEIISINISSLGGRPPFQWRGFNERLPWFPGRAQIKIRRQGEESEGRLVWDVFMYSMSNIEFIPSRVILPDQPAVSGLLAIDASEADVLTEVNRRLDAITSQANWMEPYDLDGSGHVDEEEWSIFRGKVMAEVRAELSERAVLTPTQGVEEVHGLSDPLVQEDDEEEVLW